MARYVEPTKAQERGWKEWVAGRPPNVRAVAERFDPWSLYRMKPTGDRVSIASFGEEKAGGKVTVKVNVLAEFNLTLFETSVFGIDPDNLEPCELPAPGEATGALLTDGEVGENIDVLRAIVRPDLFVMDEQGKAVRKN